jgi:hypothetical protein
MEFKIALGHGPVVWAVELVASDLDTGKEVDRFMLMSCMSYHLTNEYASKLQQFTGFDLVYECVNTVTGT